MEDQKQEKQVSSRKPYMFLAGAIVGGAIAHFLNTPQGRKMTRDIVDKSVSLSNEVKDSAESFYAKAKDQAQTTADKAKSAVESLAGKAAETGNYITEKSRTSAVNHLESLESGIANAKRKLANGSVSEA